MHDPELNQKVTRLEAKIESQDFVISKQIDSIKAIFTLTSILVTVFVFASGVYSVYQNHEMANELDRKFAELAKDAFSKPFLELRRLQQDLLEGKTIEVKRQDTSDFNFPNLILKNTGKRSTQFASLRLYSNKKIKLKNLGWRELPSDLQGYETLYWQSGDLKISPDECWILDSAEAYCNEKEIKCLLKAFCGGERPAEATFTILFQSHI